MWGQGPSSCDGEPSGGILLGLLFRGMPDRDGLPGGEGAAGTKKGAPPRKGSARKIQAGALSQILP